MARINVLIDFAEHWREKWKADPDPRVFQEAVKVVSWNFWQIDGLFKDFLSPLKELKENKPVAKAIFTEPGTNGERIGEVSSPCVIKLWNEDSKGERWSLGSSL